MRAPNQKDCKFVISFLPQAYTVFREKQIRALGFPQALLSSSCHVCCFKASIIYFHNALSMFTTTCTREGEKVVRCMHWNNSFIVQGTLKMYLNYLITYLTYTDKKLLLTTIKDFENEIIKRNLVCPVGPYDYSRSGSHRTDNAISHLRYFYFFLQIIYFKVKPERHSTELMDNVQYLQTTATSAPGLA